MCVGPVVRDETAEFLDKADGNERKVQGSGLLLNAQREGGKEIS